MRRAPAIICFITTVAFAATTEPAEPDYSTPQAALATYFRAQQELKLAPINDAIDISPAYRKDYVDRVVSFQLWSHFLERAAIKAFGKTPGLRVLGHVRSLDDQLALDLQRLKTANIQYDDTQSNATIFLPVEKDRPDNLQADRFTYLDAYQLHKTPDGWKIDFLKTYDSLDPDKQQQYQFEQVVFPKMAAAMKELSDRLAKKGFTNADALKAAVDQKWKETYDSMEKADAVNATQKQ